MTHINRIYLGAVAAMCSSIAAADALHGFCSDCTGSSPVGVAAVGSPIDFGFWDVGKVHHQRRSQRYGWSLQLHSLDRWQAR